MGYNISKDQYEEAAKNSTPEPLEAEGHFLTSFFTVREAQVLGDTKTILEFKVLEGEHEGKVKTEWLRFENVPDEIKYDDQRRKQHYAAVNTVSKLGEVFGKVISDVVADLTPELGREVYITVKAAQNKDKTKTYYNIKEFKAEVPF